VVGVVAAGQRRCGHPALFLVEVANFLLALNHLGGVDTHRLFGIAKALYVGHHRTNIVVARNNVHARSRVFPYRRIVTQVFICVVRAIVGLYIEKVDFYGLVVHFSTPR
jgi:hypothetical protein